MNEGNGNRHSHAPDGIVNCCNLFREQFGKVDQNYTCITLCSFYRYTPIVCKAVVEIMLTAALFVIVEAYKQLNVHQ